ncbi:nucleotidyltransferase domain-containing protein [bacterium]|nr:nucleotidyltransferase domain-containing protein [bacterium]
MVEREILNKLKEFKKILEANGIRITKMILYGSRLTGKFHEDSDIDVALVSPDFGKDRFDEGVKLFQFACKIDPRIEPVPISPQSYEHDTWIPLIYEIRENGLELDMGI